MYLAKPHQIEIKEVESNQLSPSQNARIRVKMLTASICETDVKIYKGSIKTKKLPIVMGHEGIGEIVDVSSSSKTFFKAGDRVLIDPNVYDYVCDLCRHGKTNLCKNGGLMGRDVDGLLSEYIYVSEDHLYKLPENIDITVGPLIQPLSTVIHSHKILDLNLGDTVLILGLGTTGLMHVQISKLKGTYVIGTSRSKSKLNAAKELGADFVISSLDDGFKDEILNLTDNKGVDAIIDTTGDSNFISELTSLLKPGGKLMLFGTSEQNISFSIYNLYFNEFKILTSRSSTPSDFVDSINLVSEKKVNLKYLVSKTTKLDEISKVLESRDVDFRTVISF